jgi:type IV pilus assembly protein PilC
MFGRALSTQNLIDLCRVLRHNLSAGLTLQKVFRQQASGAAGAVRPLAGRVLQAIEQGESLFDALEGEKDLLPPLFRAMVKVGEQTGHLPEIFQALEQHYLLEQKLRRQIMRQTLGTIIQFVLAVFVIAGLIFILGVIAESRPGTMPISIFGLRGGGGALTFLAVIFGTIGLVWLAGAIFLRYPRHAAPVQDFLLRLPGLGPALYSLVMGRFTMALRLTLDSGLSVVKGLKLSLQATGNALFISKTDVISLALKNGESLSFALAKSALFEEEFLHIVLAAEEGGRVPEMMQHQAEYWHEEASRRLATLARLLTFGLWLIYAGFMIYAIFQIASVYLSALNA